MRVLIAEDEAVSRTILERSLALQGYDVVSTRNGKEAWERLSASDGPQLAVLDWVMPEVDGLEVCRRLRARTGGRYVYTLLVTSRSAMEDTLTALAAGADDFISKPYDARELEARLRTGQRVISLQQALECKVAELEQALGQVKQLEGIIPICMHCKNIRDSKQTWHKLEAYIAKHSRASFSHGLCHTCLDTYYPEPDGV